MWREHRLKNRLFDFFQLTDNGLQIGYDRALAVTHMFTLIMEQFMNRPNGLP